jgi:UTP--glucose-1-phosphate uridylyltransferase|tara:strand:+ start:93 stop:953 length:861 start_codon:yes stop_codon:yes gene_type:complete
MISKVIIPAAGLGKRLLSITKEIPKEMLPLITTNENKSISVKPLVQIIFEQFYEMGFREFCFIVGKGKRAIEDHFSPDYRYLDQLNTKDKIESLTELEKFYNRIEDSTLVWINQPVPKGFGHAVLQARSFTNNESFLVHAGDTLIKTEKDENISQIINTHEKEGADATLCLLQVDNTEQYGIAEITGSNSPYHVKRVIEKPKEPPTNLAIMPIYAFGKTIYETLDETKPGKGGEIQLTDGIQKLIDWKQKVLACELTNALHLDIGTPLNYWNALKQSHRHLANNEK